jgi:hypothetical protein
MAAAAPSVIARRTQTRHRAGFANLQHHRQAFDHILIWASSASGSLGVILFFVTLGGGDASGVRLTNWDALDLAKHVRKGTAVTIASSQRRSRRERP